MSAGHGSSYPRTRTTFTVTRWLAAAAAVLLPGCRGAAAPRIDSRPAVPATATDLATIAADIGALAADSMGGRETGTVGAEAAAAYLARRLRAMGVEPAGDSLYHQRVSLVRHRITTASRVTVSDGRITRPLTVGTEIVPVLSIGPDAPEPRRSARGEVVFMGWGVAMPGAPAVNLAAVTGRVAVVVHGAPRGLPDTTRQRLEGQAMLAERIARLLPYAPLAVVVVMSPETMGFYRQALPGLVRSISAPAVRVARSDAGRPLPMLLLAASTATVLLPDDWPANAVPRLLGRTMHAEVVVANEPVVSHNVVGVVRGTDPALRRSVVAVVAHYDHLGSVPSVGDDTIANGADDNASGTAALLAVARRMAEAPSGRSILLVLHTGEEQGLLGSRHFIDRPPLPLDSIVALVNVDMVGRNAGDELFVIGPRAAAGGRSAPLGALLDSVNARSPRPFILRPDWDDAAHPEQLFQRSDHFPYAQRGVPVLLLTSGLHADYHGPKDEAAFVNVDKVWRVSRLVGDLVTALADPARRR